LSCDKRASYHEHTLAWRSGISGIKHSCGRAPATQSGSMLELNRSSS
jgi:hypothetical protein